MPKDVVTFLAGAAVGAFAMLILVGIIAYLILGA